MDNYQCQKCATLIQSSATPRSSGCPAAPIHRWTKLGPTGTRHYQCKKCGTLVQAERTPASSGCPQAPVHQWTKL